MPNERQPNLVAVPSTCFGTADGGDQGQGRLSRGGASSWILFICRSGRLRCDRIRWKRILYRMEGEAACRIAPDRHRCSQGEEAFCRPLRSCCIPSGISRSPSLAPAFTLLTVPPSALHPRPDHPGSTPSVGTPPGPRPACERTNGSMKPRPMPCERCERTSKAPMTEFVRSQ